MAWGLPWQPPRRQPPVNQELSGTQTPSPRQIPTAPVSSVHDALTATSKLQAPETQPVAVRHSVEEHSVETQQSM